MHIPIAIILALLPVLLSHTLSEMEQSSVYLAYLLWLLPHAFIRKQTLFFVYVNVFYN